MKKLSHFILIASFILTAGCHKAQKAPPPENRIDKATLMIDQGDFDSAIEILEDGLTNQVDTPKLRLVLASAYAGRAGVKVENYWNYLVGYDVFIKESAPEETVELIPANRIPETVKEEEKNKISLLNKYYQDFQRLENKTSKIPTIQKKDRLDLYQARKVIQAIEAPSVRLYRSMLTAVVVKSEIAEGSPLLKAWADSLGQNCQNSLPEFSKWLVQTMDLVSDGLNDLGQAYPDENENYQSIRKKISGGIDLTETLQKQSQSLEVICPQVK